MPKSNELLLRARQLIRVADLALNALFWLCMLFLVGGGILLSLGAFIVNPLLGGLALLAAALAAYVVSEKKEKASGLLRTASELLEDGEKGPRARQRIVDMLKSIVEEALGTAALSCAVVPGGFAFVGVILAIFKFVTAARLVFIVALALTAGVACLYYPVHFFAMREIGRVVGGLLGAGKDERTTVTEREPLLRS